MIRAALPSVLLLAGCATYDTRPGWTYRTSYGVGDPERPVALYGWPETLASFALECDAGRHALLLVSLDVAEFAGARPIVVEAGRATWTGSEVADPPDAVATSRTFIPLDHPVVDALVSGAPIRLRTAEGVFVVRGGAAPARVVRECRRMATPPIR